MSKGLGNYAAGAVIYGKFTTFRPSTGAAFTLGGTPALSVYKDNSTTQSTAGVTLTADFDSVTGLNHFAIDTSADGTFYSANSNFDIVVTTGTVDSVSVVGTVVASFSLDKAVSIVPALSVTSQGEPAGPMPASATLVNKIGAIYMALRNRVDVNATQKIFYTDGGSVHSTKTLSDNGTTYSESEAA